MKNENKLESKMSIEDEDLEESEKENL